MAQFFQIHPKNPQQRLISRAVDIIEKGGLIVYPTDSSYAIACHINDKHALDRIRRIRQLDDKHNFTLVCINLTQISNFAKISNDSHRLIKALTPGPFTFLLDATREVPRRLQHAKKKTIGIRIPDNEIDRHLIETLGEPLISTTLILPETDTPLTDPYEIRELLEHEIELVIDGGIVDYEPTTIISCAGQKIEIVRQGKGIASMLE